MGVELPDCKVESCSERYPEEIRHKKPTGQGADAPKSDEREENKDHQEQDIGQGQKSETPGKKQPAPDSIDSKLDKIEYEGETGPLEKRALWNPPMRQTCHAAIPISA